MGEAPEAARPNSKPRKSGGGKVDSRNSKDRSDNDNNTNNNNSNSSLIIVKREDSVSSTGAGLTYSSHSHSHSHRNSHRLTSACTHLHCADTMECVSGEGNDDAVDNVSGSSEDSWGMKVHIGGHHHNNNATPITAINNKNNRRAHCPYSSVVHVSALGEFDFDYY